MKYEDKKILVVSILMIAFLGLLSYRNFSKIILPETTAPLRQIPKIELPTIEEMTDMGRALLENNVEPSEFKYADYNLTDKITFRYPSHWIKSDVGEIEGHENTVDHLFMAFSRDITPTIIIGLRLSQPDFKSAIQIVKDIFQQEDIVMNILNQTTNNNKVYFEAEYIYPDDSRMISKEKIILLDGHAYLITVMGPENWSDERAYQARYIINSIQFID